MWDIFALELLAQGPWVEIRHYDHRIALLEFLTLLRHWATLEYWDNRYATSLHDPVVRDVANQTIHGEHFATWIFDFKVRCIPDNLPITDEFMPAQILDFRVSATHTVAYANLLDLDRLFHWHCRHMHETLSKLGACTAMSMLDCMQESSSCENGVAASDDELGRSYGRSVCMVCQIHSFSSPTGEALREAI